MAGSPHRWRWPWRIRRSEPLDARLDQEIQFHIEQETARNIRQGMSAAEARRAAAIRFGSAELLKERTRDEFAFASVRELARDLRLATRVLARNRTFALTTVLTLGLGLGVVTAAFSVIDGVLLKPLPYPHSDRLVRLFQLDDAGRRMNNVSGPNFHDWQRLTHSFSAMAEIAPWGSVPVVAAAQPTMATVALVSRDFFEVMGVRPSLGRTFTSNESRRNGEPAVMVSHAFWVTRVGGPATLEGRTIRVGERIYPIVGVMPMNFDYPLGTDIWAPSELNEPAQDSRTAHNYQVISRVRDNLALAAARTELTAVSRQLKQQYGEDTWMSDATAVPVLDVLTVESKPALELLFAAALLLLVVANTNVSSLLLARAAARRHEFAVQLAIGAGRLRLGRQVTAEVAVLCLAGAAVGALAASWAVKWIAATAAGLAPRMDLVAVDRPVLVFAAVASAASAVVLGLLTTASIRDTGLSAVLSHGYRTIAGDRRGLAVRHFLIATQVAMTLVLLAGVGLLGRSFLNVIAVNPGYRVDDALVLDTTVAFDGNDWRARKVAFLDRLLDGLSVLPGVTTVGMTTGFPLGDRGNYSNGQFLEMTSVDEFHSFADAAQLGPAAAKARTGQAAFRVVSSGYFQAMGIPLVRGRLFERSDGPDAPHVAVISQSLAKVKWPDRDPVGRFVQFGNMDGDLTGFRIIGVVGDVRERTLETTPRPTFYASYRQRPNSIWSVSMVVRGDGGEGLNKQARALVRQLNPELPVQARTIEDAFDASLAGRRVSFMLVAALGVAALALAMLGLYGLIAYLVAQRTREIGIRLALGATPFSVVKLVVVRGALLAVGGGLVGLGISLAAARFVRSLLFDVSPTDPAILVGVTGVTVLAAVLASLTPAVRAARTAPTDSLRDA